MTPRLDEKRMAHQRNLDSLAEATRRLREHNDEVETKLRMRERGSLPPPGPSDFRELRAVRR
jgi:hypothetical protein